MIEHWRVNWLSILNLENICMEKEGEALIKGLSLRVNAGERLLIEGKSIQLEMLVKLLQGKEAPRSGVCEFMGRELASLSNSGLSNHRKLKLVYLQLKDSYNSQFTAEGLIQQPLKYSGVYPSKWKKKIVEVSDKLGIGEILKKSMSELTAFEEFKAYIARGIVVEPKLLILLDPLLYFPEVTLEEIMTVLEKLQNIDIAVMILSVNNRWRQQVDQYLPL